MEKLIEKIDNLKKVLDENEKIIDVKSSSELLMKDKKLLELIEKYNLTQDESIKEKIISNTKFREYKKKETNLNIIILEINQRLKEINDKGKCGI